MMFTVADVTRRLRDSLIDIEFGLSMLPVQWSHELLPGAAPDNWTVAKNIAHLVVYEEELANPVLASLAAGGDGTDAIRKDLPSWFEPDSEALAAEPLGVLSTRLRAAREQHIAIVEQFSEERLNAPSCPHWGTRYGGDLHPAGWVASKTWQHTWEHGNAVLRAGLFAPR